LPKTRSLSPGCPKRPLLHEKRQARIFIRPTDGFPGVLDEDGDRVGKNAPSRTRLAR
jgi:hypothetical protein